MKVRGQRECKDCGTRWSYYETGSVTCPACGSVHSVGVDEHTTHTDGAVALDLTDARDAIDGRPLREVADRAKEAAREYVRGRGFIKGGELRDLDETYLAARELLEAADAFGRSLDPTDDEELYFLSLLRDADEGRRPAVEEVPPSVREVRGLAYANAVREYRREMADWCDERDADGSGRDALETLGEHVRRVRALEGDVDPEAAEALVRAARELSTYLRAGDEEALERAREEFDRLA